jgi:serine/threonine protein kinase
MKSRKKIDNFDFPSGMEVSSKYRVVKKLGWGWEGEVYQIRETLTGIERAAKFFYPHRNVGNKSARLYAQKLHKLRSCKILIQYLTQGKILFRGVPITFLVSEYVNGIPLEDFLGRQKEKRLTPFQALHLLHSLAKGLDDIHNLKEYHGDLHSGNVIIERYGLGFDLKILDLFFWDGGSKENQIEDLIKLIGIFYESLGGAKYYASLPKEVKGIILGQKRTLIYNKFKTLGQLKTHIETLSWDKF